MRMTVELPDEVRRRVQALAENRRMSMSATIADLTIRGLVGLGEPLRILVDDQSGFPVVSLGRRVTSDDIAALLDEE